MQGIHHGTASNDTVNSVNRLFYGDNLDILPSLSSESVDLVYLDPPFKSNQDYNVLFKEHDGSRSASQLQAFEDTWTWSDESREAYDRAVLSGGKMRDVMEAFKTFLGTSDMMAYLAMMAPRLRELHRVLAPTGSLYLHCDPTASHYLKLLLDAVFEPQNFRNEIVWQRTNAKSLMTRQLPTNHDVVLCYQKTANAYWNADAMFQSYDAQNLDPKTAKKYCHVDADGRRYRLDNLINPNRNRPNLTYEFLGVRRVWRWTKERMKKAYEDGIVIQTKPGTVPQMKRYLDEQRGRPLGDVWTDISPVNSQAKERLGYPTQKPQALLERIISASTREDALVLDPFCGCGTTIGAAQSLKRRWIGIDITAVAFEIIHDRLEEDFGKSIHKTYVVENLPASMPDALTLAKKQPFGFQRWVLECLGVNPLDIKPGPDHGIDGRLNFKDGSKTREIVFSVKTGKLSPEHVRSLKAVTRDRKAQIGVLVTVSPPTAAMKKEAADSDPYRAANGDLFPGIQIITLRQIFDGQGVKCPDGAVRPFKMKLRPAKAGMQVGEQQRLQFA